MDIEMCQDTGKGKSSSASQLEEMYSIFPDCDPDFILEQLEEQADNPNRYEIVSAALFEKAYPKLADKQRAERVSELHRKL